MGTSQSTSQGREDFENGEVEERAVKVGEINAADCPEFQAAPYPGKFSRKKRGGTKLSRGEFKEQQVKEWVAHFGDDPKYDNTSLAHKVLYLVQHLAPLKVKNKEARAILVKVESEKELRPGEGIVRGEGEEQVNEDQEEEDEEGDQEEEDEEGEGLDEEEAMDFVEARESESDDEMTEDEEMETEQERESRAVREFEIGKYLDKTDQELFSSDMVIPEFVERSVGYKLRKENFVNAYLEQEDFQDSQEILLALSQAPAVVKGSLNDKLQHLTNQEKATRVVMKSLSDTIKRLKETPGKAAREQVQIILAAVSHYK